MTDRITAYLVTLDEPTRGDDAEVVLTTLRQIRGVISVEPVVRDGLSEQAAINRRDAQWTQEIGRAVRAVILGVTRKENDHG
jgi:hypothetical protein